MGTYLLQRALRAVVTLVGISVAVFILTRVFGDPVTLMLPEDASSELLLYTRESLGLNDPLHVQFKGFVLDAFHGDFGESVHQGISSRDLLLKSLPATATLAVVAFALAAVLGLALGILASLKPRSALDIYIGTISMTGVSIPEFWLALLLIMGVAANLGVLPTSGYGSWQHLVLPALVLSVQPMARIAQLTRSSMVDELQQSYVRTAQAKGLTKPVIVWRHMLRNASVPIVTIMGIQVADLLGGAIIVETIFGWPGVGRLAATALRGWDFPLIQTVVFWAALMTVTINLIVDLSYAWLNPRIRHGSA